MFPKNFNPSNNLIKGHLYRLREVESRDAQFIVKLRNDERLNRFINKSASGIQKQNAWLEDYFERKNDFYFIVENLITHEPEGLISVYDINFADEFGEWGRWIILPGSLAATESAYLIYEFSFEHLGLSKIFCRTVKDNASVISFHDNCGAKRVDIHPNYLMKNGRYYTAIEHEVLLENWRGNIRSKLENTSMRIAQKCRSSLSK